MDLLVQYPVIAIDKEHTLVCARSSDDLTVCSARGLANGFYNHLILVDCAGYQYCVLRAEKIGTVGPFWGFNLLGGQRLRVKLHFDGERGEISLPELKTLVRRVFRQDPYFWDSDGELKGRMAFVGNARSHREIIEHMTSEFYEVHSDRS